MKIRDRIAALRRTYPNISRSHARYLYADREALKLKGKKIIVWAVLWSDDGRVSLHRTEFGRQHRMSVPEWAGWLQVNGPLIFVESILAYANRSFGSSWNLERVFGWHFESAKKRTKR